MKDTLEYSKPRRDWNIISRAEEYCPDINDHIVLQTPHDQYRLQQNEKVAIAVYFKNYLELNISPRRLSKYIPDVVHQWGRSGSKGTRRQSTVSGHNGTSTRNTGMCLMQGYVNQKSSY